METVGEGVDMATDPCPNHRAFLFEQPVLEHNTGPAIRVLKLNAPSPSSIASPGLSLIYSVAHPINPPLARSL